MSCSNNNESKTQCNNSSFTQNNDLKTKSLYTWFLVTGKYPPEYLKYIN